MRGGGKGCLLGTLALVAAALLLPSAAQATPPTLDSVGESAPGVLTADWLLPSGMTSYYVDVGTSPRTDTIGAFRLSVLFDLVGPDDTTWEAGAALPPGTYYIHVAALDLASCNPDCVEEFSNVIQWTISGTQDPPAHPPVLDTVGHTNRHLTADWTLPAGESADFIEVATASDAYPGGDFLEQNNVIFESLGGNETSYTSTQQLPAGTYYVHVAGTDDAKCPTGTDPGCFIDEYSNTKVLTIPPDPGPPPSPVLESVGQDARHLTAAWTLPGGLENDFIEAATNPAVDTDGMFLGENTVLFDVAIEPTQTSYLSTDQLDPGTYYVHVGTLDPACFICPDIFTNTLPITIPPDSSATGGGSGSSSSAKGSQPKPAPVAADKATAFRVLVAAAKQRVGKLFVVASMAEAGTITARGTVSVPSLSKLYRFKAASANATAGVTVILKPKLPKKALKAVKKALKRHKKIKAKLTITARDKAGNTKTESRTVALKP